MRISAQAMSGCAQKLLPLIVVLVLGSDLVAQTPQVFDLSNVVVGARRVHTAYFHAVGKWSDSARWSDAEKVGVLSTELRCYKSFGLCEEADAYFVTGQAIIGGDSYSVLRWNTRELFAEDSEAPCVVRTLRIDFGAKSVTASTRLKGSPGDARCREFSSRDERTALLSGLKEEKAEVQQEPGKR